MYQRIAFMFHEKRQKNEVFSINEKQLSYKSRLWHFLVQKSQASQVTNKIVYQYSTYRMSYILL